MRCLPSETRAAFADKMRDMKLKLAGLALAAGSILLWLAWVLMPDAATNDAAHILAAVASQRDAVHRSTILQLAGAALLVPGPGRRGRARTRHARRRDRAALGCDGHGR